MAAMIDQEFKDVKKKLDFKYLQPELTVSFSTPNEKVAERVLGDAKAS